MLWLAECLPILKLFKTGISCQWGHEQNDIFMNIKQFFTKVLAYFMLLAGIFSDY